MRMEALLIPPILKDGPRLATNLYFGGTKLLILANGAMTPFILNMYKRKVALDLLKTPPTEKIGQG